MAYVVMLVGITIAFGISAIVDLRRSIQYWAIIMGVITFLTPLYSFQSYIKVDKDHLIVKRDIRRKYGYKKIKVKFDEINFIQEIEVKATYRGKPRSRYSFGINLKGRSDLNFIDLDLYQFSVKDLKRLFLTLENEYKITRKVMIKGRNFREGI